MREAFERIVGNRRLRERLCDDVQNGRVSHAYILEGPAGSGKHTLAYQLAAALSCEHRHSLSHPLPCGTCPSCKKILGGHSTDVIVKNRGEKATFGVDVIREIKQDVYVAPNESAAKVYVIEEADLMTVPAQNAFLLTLEEPPAYVLFLLLCESAEPLLETVRSRAPVLRTEPITTDDIDRYLVRESAEAVTLRAQDPTEYTELLAAANGSIGRALTLLDAKERKPILTRRSLARTFLQLCTERKNSLAAVRFLNSMSPKREELCRQLSTLLICLRDLLLCKQTESAPLCFFADREEAVSLAYEFTTPELLGLCDTVQDTLNRLYANANINLTLTSLAVRANLL
ncbi:MAG: DNA polymerase III subunit [Clostridia bacterium]|nr:DNA polymerase III subunit [Clostridia bacterium]